MTTWFAPIGISQYEDLDDLTAIPGAVRSLWAYVEEAFDEPAVLGGLEFDRGVWDRDQLAELLGTARHGGALGKVEPEDTVLIYWAGHGFVAGEHRLALSAAGESVLTRELADWLLGCRASTIVCILDCCGAGAGLVAINDLASSLKQAEAPEAREHRRIGLIVSGREEDTLEGALITTMLEVLRRGPHSDLGEAHAWDKSTRRIRIDQLVAAINFELEEDQQAVADDLRDLSLGAFFPSIWHRSNSQTRPSPIPLASKARRDTEILLIGAGVQVPAAWTEECLSRVVANLPDGLPVEVGQQIAVRIAALCMAQSAQTWTRNMVDRTKINKEMLLAAQKAATGVVPMIPFETEYDFFCEAATERVGRRRGSAAARTLCFMARLVHEVDPISDHRPALFQWAYAHGLTEDFEINETISEAQTRNSGALLMIDLRNSPDLSAVDAFPSSAVGTIFDDALSPGPSEIVPISQQNDVGVSEAVASLMVAFRSRGVTSVHLLVPDQLLPFDAGAVKVQLTPRHTVHAGERYDVRVHCDRTEDDRFYEFDEYYRDAVAERCPRVYFDDCPAAERVSDLWREPPALIFRFPVASESAESLLDAIWTSPIVIWPASEPSDRDELVNDLDQDWPDIPQAVNSARWTKTKESESFRHLRMSWDDSDWLRLLRENYARRG